MPPVMGHDQYMAAHTVRPQWGAVPAGGGGERAGTVNGSLKWATLIFHVPSPFPSPVPPSH